jgi:putative redox protein
VIEAAATGDANRWVTVTVGSHGFRADAIAGAHSLIIDEPAQVGGTDAGPTPYEYLLTAVGSCTAMTLRLYADRKEWPLESITVQLRSANSHEKDCEECETKKVGIAHIERRVIMTGHLTDEQRSRLLEIADRCPVKQTIERGIHIDNAPPTTI